MSTIYIPDYNATEDCHTGGLYAAFYEDPRCFTYDLKTPFHKQLREDATKYAGATVAVVHGFGFYVFCEAYENGLFRGVQHLIVLDGCGLTKFKLDDLGIPAIKSLYFFPAEGERAFHKELEDMIKDLPYSIIVRGKGLDRQITFCRSVKTGRLMKQVEEFGIKHVKQLVEKLKEMMTEIEFDIYDPKHQWE